HPSGGELGGARPSPFLARAFAELARSLIGIGEDGPRPLVSRGGLLRRFPRSLGPPTLVQPAPAPRGAGVDRFPCAHRPFENPAARERHESSPRSRASAIFATSRASVAARASWSEWPSARTSARASGPSSKPSSLDPRPPSRYSVATKA